MAKPFSPRLVMLTLLVASLTLVPQFSTAQGGVASTKPTIVLVHGAFADATGWQHVIPILQKDGYNVIAVQNPLSSLPDDIATTKRVIDAQKGPVIVVAHSYGGSVITGAAAGNPNVKGLVYLAAFAPDSNEAVGAFLEKYPAAVGAAFRPDAAGYVYIDRAMFHDIFAKDVPAVEASVMSVTQKPLNSTVFTAIEPVAAWKTIPSWFLVSKKDQVINPELERFYAKRMGAKTQEIDASHVAFISQPKVVAKFIEDAAMAMK